jgi:hypothetical protein
MRDAHATDGAILLQPRWTMSFMRGPMTRSEIRLALERGGRGNRAEPPATGGTNGQSEVRYQAE